MKIVSFISDKFFMPEQEVRNYLRTVPRRYKQFTIDKRNGEPRLIAQPAKQVKALQVSVLSELKRYIPIHECAYAYQSGRNIKANALLHAKNSYLLKMDFKNFFLSIKPEVFLNVLSKHGIAVSEDDALSIANLFFWKLRRNSPLRLSIGAPSSPFISNATMYFFDSYLSAECKKIDVDYSRYADDLTFSTKTKGILKDIPLLVKKALEMNDLKTIKINNSKTVFSSKKFNRHVTGITLNNNGDISLGRNKKRFLSSRIHYYSLGLLNNDDILELKGLLGFANYIEPIFLERMKVKYGDDLIVSIQKYIG
ncbi:retron St85 family RNA-directed DNA polymerase [Serratia sp. PGPR-27]|uniref:retron St85 family RNA-directed DNA polymerase n=1 Tax=Serratia sp. PGPR-27 TaxID=2923365 RepID=UPI001F566ED2|nr:retron St85 family RNA-directed DNA polymerase [Serratia sp. PGPR-27]MCI2401784.1 retron St85 family RNA-directed DNA polymerase [Serratia sp. PGPR-27]HCU0428652.1 retron St85 family RNA-directed DNA polymerase [Serratia marcescens]